MNANAAKAKGYSFTGIWEAAISNGKEIAKREAAKIRAKGFRACVVFDPGERRDGYAVFAENRYLDSASLRGGIGGRIAGQ